MAGDEGGHARGYSVMQFREEVPAPPPGFVSPFRSIEEWLMAIISAESPQKKITEYKFLFFGVSGDFLLGLAGYNAYRDNGIETYKIDFKPSPMFFALPKDIYDRLPMMEAHGRVVDELIAFTRTAAFQDSFFTAAGFH